MHLEKASSRLEALGNPTRLKIYRLLVRAGGQGSSVGKLQTTLDIPASTLSHHLKALVAAGLVMQDREATTLICRANYAIMNELVGFLVNECCADGCLPQERVHEAEAG